LGLPLQSTVRRLSKSSTSARDSQSSVVGVVAPALQQRPGGMRGWLPHEWLGEGAEGLEVLHVVHVESAWQRAHLESLPTPQPALEKGAARFRARQTAGAQSFFLYPEHLDVRTEVGVWAVEKGRMRYLGKPEGPWQVRNPGTGRRHLGR
jgi:hypothetical protein